MKEQQPDIVDQSVNSMWESAEIVEKAALPAGGVLVDFASHLLRRSERGRKIYHLFKQLR